jgi:proline iminopeptidase
VRRALLRRPGGDGDAEAMIEHGVQLLRAMSSPAYPTAEKHLRRRVARALRRSCCPGGIVRQMLAVTACGDRTPQLRTVVAPTLVIHGAADPMVPLACGVDTARAIPGARLEVIEGMGHDLPAQLMERLLALIDAHAHGKMAPDLTPRLFVKQ